MTYAILFHPGHNRVYFESALQFAAAEFAVVTERFSVPCENPRTERIGGIPYLCFETDSPLPAAELRAVCGLSFVYALFTLEDAPRRLYPLEKTNVPYINEGMGSMLKYTGKTNELFTRMLLNLALAAQDTRENVRLLDPLAGKGTTLFEGLVKGCDVYGVEIGEKAAAEACRFLDRFLQGEKYKFEQKTLRISGEKKVFSARRHSFVLAASKEDFKAKRVKTAELISGSSQFADRYFKKNFFDILVSDLPYGVQHGNVTNEGQSGLTRNPGALLEACLPAWTAVLKPGGAMALSWNAHVLPRAKMVQLLEKHGLAVRKGGAHARFAHRVDQAILRDVVLAVKMQ